MHGWKFNPQINTQGDKDREREFAFWLDHGSAFFCVVCVLFICFDCGWEKERDRKLECLFYHPKQDHRQRRNDT
jgi:hypothetical protein